MDADRRTDPEAEVPVRERDRATRRDQESLQRARRAFDDNSPHHRPAARKRRDGGHLPPRFYLGDDEEDDLDFEGADDEEE